MLEVREVKKNFGGIHALTGATFTLGEGELKCIIGPNGCGKSTLFNVITGALKPSSGQVFFKGRDITGLAPQHISRLGFGRKFQVPAVFNDVTVAENAELAGLATSTKKGFWSMFSTRLDYKAVDRHLEEFGLLEYKTTLARELPHGLKQRLEIMMLILSEARVILLDEPTAGMSPSETADTADLIRHVRTNFEASVLVIEHDMAFVRNLDCPMVVMIKGAVVREGCYGDIKDDPEIRKAYLGDRQC